MWETVIFGPATAKGKRLRAVFEGDGKRRTINFGADGATTYADGASKRVKAAWLARHGVREDWTRPDTAGSLSRWVLWGNSRSIPASQNAFAKRFGLILG
jgi:hypothetical protein